MIARIILLSVAALTLLMEAPATDNLNATRVEDWDTLLLLTNTKLTDVSIDAESPESLIKQLHTIVGKVEAAKGLRFRFDRNEWEIELSDGSIGEVEFSGSLKLESTDLITLVRFVCEAGLMTFDVKDGEIVFRPSYC